MSCTDEYTGGCVDGDGTDIAGNLIIALTTDFMVVDVIAGLPKQVTVNNNSSNISNRKKKC